METPDHESTETREETAAGDSNKCHTGLPKRRGPVGRVIRWTAAAVLVLLVGLLIAPSLLSRRWIYQPLVDRFARIDHRLQIESISAGWLTPLNARGISVQQPDGEVMLRIAEVASSLTLLDLLFTDGNLQTIVIKHPEVHVRLLEDSNNVRQFVSAIDGRTPQRVAEDPPPAVNVTLDIRNLLIRVDDVREDTRLLETNPARFQVHYLAAEGTRRIEIPPARIVDRLQLTPELLGIGLQLALPAFYKATAVDGEISIDLQHCTIPLDEPMESDVEGIIWLHEVAASARAPMLQTAIQITGVVTRRELEPRLVVASDSKVPFKVSERRVYHEGLRFGVPRIDERLQFQTNGWVDLNKQTEMTLSAPVPIEMLARREAVQAMGVPTINLQVTGSLDEPQIDLPATGSQVLELAAEIFRRRRAEADEDRSFDTEASDESGPSILGGIDPSAELAREGAKVIGGLLEKTWERRARERQDTEASDEDAPLRRRGPLRRLFRRPQTSEDAPE